MRHWWQSVGRIGFNAEFVAEVDAFLARPTTLYFEAIRSYDSSAINVASPAAETHSVATAR